MNTTETKNYIAEALFKLLDANNLNDITITKLCNKAGTSRMSFYRYFKNVNDVIDYYIEDKYIIFTNNLNLLTLRNKDLLDKLHYIFKFVKDNYKILFILKKIDYNILKYDNNFIINSKSKYDTLFYSGAIINIIRYWIESGMKESINDMSFIVYNIIKKTNLDI